MTSLLDQIISEAGRIILGKERILRLSLACMLARGHLLIEDLPGVGKTTLAHLLADEINRATPKAERALLAGEDRRDLLAHLRPLIRPEQLLDLQERVTQVFVPSRY